MGKIALLAETLHLNTGGDSSGLIHALFLVLIIGICIALIWAAGRWFITKMAAPALVMTVWNGFFLLVGLIIVINFLMSLVGHGFITY
jgi:hypothetical protein